VKKQRNVSRK